MITELVIGNILAPLLFFLALEYRNGLIKLTKGNKKAACYLFGSVQVLVTYWRYLCGKSIFDSDAGSFDVGTFIQVAAWAMILFGQLLNVMVYYRIGILGVYYGNAFGIELPWVTKFPFGTIPNPQYTGVTLTTLGTALLEGSANGLIYTLATIVSYYAVIKIENYYFSHIDAERKALLKKVSA
eukprot:TRINITY_DN782145_c0_g1_i1.p1 TRINITY_DN782145_c0_g1~~TRINITY_DN782145_c0_g1_i1.p1  ORF type:complete len:201 (-),score=43.61 TRINITY_DN782145_c0_g1_i1:264-815(-)